jgi:hypothetical protein
MRSAKSAAGASRWRQPRTRGKAVGQALSPANVFESRIRGSEASPLEPAELAGENACPTF